MGLANSDVNRLSQAEADMLARAERTKANAAAADAEAEAVFAKSGVNTWVGLVG